MFAYKKRMNENTFKLHFVVSSEGFLEIGVIFRASPQRFFCFFYPSDWFDPSDIFFESCQNVPVHLPTKQLNRLGTCI